MQCMRHIHFLHAVSLKNGEHHGKMNVLQCERDSVMHGSNQISWCGRSRVSRVRCNLSHVVHFVRAPSGNASRSFSIIINAPLFIQRRKKNRRHCAQLNRFEFSRFTRNLIFKINAFVVFAYITSTFEMYALREIKTVQRQLIRMCVSGGNEKGKQKANTNLQNTFTLSLAHTHSHTWYGHKCSQPMNCQRCDETWTDAQTQSFAHIRRLCRPLASSSCNAHRRHIAHVYGDVRMQLISTWIY